MTAARLVAVTVVVVTAVLALVPVASGAYRRSDGWGRLGKGPGDFGSGVLGGGALRQYDDPAGISIASDGDVFTVDTSNNRVQQFSSTGAFRNAFGGRGRDNGAINRVPQKGRFYQPGGLAIGGNGQLFVVDTGNDRVMVHSQGGAFVRRIGYHGSQAGQWVQPVGARTFGENLYVVDQGNYRVERWTLSGRFLGDWGRFGRRAGQFVTPYDVAVSPGGDRVYVTDQIRRKVIIFGPNGNFLGEFGRSGKAAGRFLKPTGIDVASDGSLFVSDRCNKRIQHYSATGTHIESFGAGALAAPTFLDVDPRGRVYVSDYRRVVVFSPTSGLRDPAPAPNARAAQLRGFDVSCSGIRG